MWWHLKCSRVHSRFCSFPALSPHPKTHTQTMAHRHHHPPLSRRCVSGHVLRAVTLPIAMVAADAFPSPVPAMSRLVAIALFVAVAIAIALAAIIIAFFDTHQCAPSPPTAIRIHSDGGVGGSLAPAVAAWRRRWQLGSSKGGRMAAVAAQQQHSHGGCISAAAALEQRRR
jgi:hypothetical protein